jgi:hypothetical protein
VAKDVESLFVIVDMFCSPYISFKLGVFGHFHVFYVRLVGHFECKLSGLEKLIKNSYRDEIFETPRADLPTAAMRPAPHRQSGRAGTVADAARPAVGQDRSYYLLALEFAFS